MTEFGKTPLLPAGQLEKIGYNILIYPVSLFRLAAGHTKSALECLKRDGFQKQLISEMMDREEINGLLNYKPE